MLKSLLSRYGIALTAVLVALLLMLALDPMVHLTQASFLLFFGAVTVSALYGGKQAGILATILASLLARYFFLAPQYSWEVDLAGGVRMILFILQGLAISYLVGALRTAQTQAQRRLDQLQASEIEITNLNQELRRQLEELRQTETTLRASEKRFRRLVESNLFGVAFGNTAGEICYANDYFLTMVGYDREDLAAGRIRWRDMTPPEFLYLDEQAAEQLAQTGVATPFEKVYIRKDGRRVPVLMGGVAPEDPTAEYQAICFYIDLTERKRTEAAWQEGKQILDALMEHIPEGITIADAPDVTIRKVSQYGLQLAGRPLADVIGTPTDTHVSDWGIFHADGVTQPQDDELPLTRAVRQSEVVVNEEWVVQRPDGHKINILCNAAPIQDAQGQTTGGILAWRDITDRKQAEVEREQLLERERLARTEAEAANRVKDEFLAVLSHELRSPLNPILGWVRILQTKQLDADKVAEALKTIERNARLQAELIEDLLNVSRILRGKLSLTIAPVDLSTTIQAAIETVRLAAEARLIQITTQFQPNLGRVAGDTSRLQQVVWNLLSNAVKFTPEGGRISVILQQVESKAQIIVQDTGKGISTEFLPHVFEYFRQADSTITRRFGGLGLGLAIVRHLVELHGGTIRAESPGEDQGATFTVSLPLMSEASYSPLPDDPPPPVPSLTGIRVLVVDDDEDSRNLIAFLLKQEQATVITAASAQAGLTALRQGQPHLVLSDIGMPDQDGYTFLQQVRSLPPEQGGLVPAIALTAYAGEYDQRQALQAGFQRHLAKPIEPERLINTISDLITLDRSPQPPN